MTDIDSVIMELSETIKSIQNNSNPSPEDISKMVTLSRSLRDSSVRAYSVTIPQYKVAKMFGITPARVSQIINWT